jgi:uncharacterized damage-inducible protein DinB
MTNADRAYLIQDGDVARLFLEQSRAYLVSEYLPKIERAVALLDDERVWWRPNEASNSVGNLLLHLAGNVRQWIVSGVGGEPDTRDRQREFDERAEIPRDEMLERLRAVLAESDAVLARLDPATLAGLVTIQGRELTVLGALYHVVEHFGMHTGQIILLSKALSGDDLKFYDLSSGTPKPTW